MKNMHITDKDANEMIDLYNAAKNNAGSEGYHLYIKVNGKIETIKAITVDFSYAAAQYKKKEMVNLEKNIMKRLKKGETMFGVLFNKKEMKFLIYDPENSSVEGFPFKIYDIEVKGEEFDIK